ncbi:O-antigen ligase family protein [Mucilaginibacter sp. AW1-3]
MKGKYSGLFSISLIVLGILVSVYLASRAFVFGYTIGLLFLLFIYYKEKLNLKNILAVCISATLTLFILVYFIKYDSSLGRILIYKISWKIFKENCFTGIGLGNFKIQYGLYQAEYFKAGAYTIKEFLLADNTYYAFNDYWEFIIEVGIPGLICLLAGFYITVNLATEALKKQGSSNTLLNLALAQLIAILVAALFTHVFEKTIVQIATIVAIFFLVIYSKPFNLNINIYMLGGGMFILFYFTIKYCNYVRHYQDYAEFNKGKELYKFGYITESINICKKIYPILNNDVEFLVFYCDVLELSENKEQTSKLLSYTITKRTNNILYLKLADNYFLNGNTQRAEQIYLQAIDMVPNRFASRFKLYNFYLKTQQIKKAKAVARYMLKMPVKIPSNSVDLIRKNIIDIK